MPMVKATYKTSKRLVFFKSTALYSNAVSYLH